LIVSLATADSTGSVVGIVPARGWFLNRSTNVGIIQHAFGAATSFGRTGWDYNIPYITSVI